MSYRDLLQFYVAQTKWPAQAPLPALPYDDLALFYQIHARRPPTPLPPQLPPASIENVDAFLTEDEVVTKEEAKEAFASVKESFASVGEEQGKLKTGLQGLASKIDEVQGKAAEDVTALAHAADEAFSHADSVASDLSARLADTERQQAAAQAAAERAQAMSDAALKETAEARREQEIARAQLEANLQTAALQAQSVAERAASHAAQAMSDARSAHVEVPRLDSTLLSLQAEMRAMKIASQQAQERALRLECELSAAQDRIGAAERRATQAEQRHSLLQKRMDDWDAFDPDLHAALNASLTPPTAGELMQPTGSSHPAGSEATVQSAHQVHPQGQTEQLFSREQLQSVLFGQPMCRQAQRRRHSHSCKLHQVLGSNRHKRLHNRCKLHQLDTVEMLWTVLLALMLHSGQLGLEEAAVALMEGVLLLHFLPSMLAPRTSKDRVRHSPFR